MELIPELANKSYHSLYNWFKKLREGMSFAIKEKLQKFHNHYLLIFQKNKGIFLKCSKNLYLYNTDANNEIIANIDKTPIVLEPITNIIL